MMGAALLAGSCLPVRADPWTFAVMGGCGGSNDVPGINVKVISDIAQDIADNHCRFVLVTGDLVPGKGDLPSHYAAWISAMAPVVRANIPIYPVRGRNEAALDPSGDAWRAAFPGLPTNGPAGEVGLTYSFAFDNAFCVALDQHVRPHRVNQGWLDAQLKANARPHIFVLGHEPAFRVSQSNCLALCAAERDVFWASLRRAGARLYFCGRDHMYNSASIAAGARPPLFQLVVGTGGAPLDHWKGKYFEAQVKMQAGNTSLFGYTLVTVEDKGIMAEWKALLPQGEWKLLDSLVIRRPIRAPPPAS